MNKTEVEVFTQTSISVDDTLVDAMFFLHTLVNPPNISVGLVHLCQISERGDFKCDNDHYHQKVVHENRSEADTGSTFVITGPKTPV